MRRGAAPSSSFRDPWLPGPLLLCVAIQTLYILLADAPFGIGDQSDYRAAGENLTLWWSVDTQAILRTPGYPALIALLGDVTAVRIAQVVVVSAGLLAVARLAHVAAGQLAARIAAVLYALYLPLLSFSSLYLTEALSVALFVIAVALVVETVRDPRPRWGTMAAATTVLAVATIVRPNMAILHVAIASALLFKAGPLVRRAVVVLVIVVPVVVLFGPWVGRNLAVEGEPNVLGRGNVYPLALGVHLPFDKEVGPYSTYTRSFRFWSGRRPDGFTPESAREADNYNQFKLNARHNTGEFAWTRIVGQAQLWVWPVTARTQYGKPEVIPYAVLMAYHLLILLAGIAGVVLLRRTLLARLTAVTVLAIAASHLVLFPQPRYALPALPLLMASAAALIAAVVARRRDSRPDDSGAVAEHHFVGTAPAAQV